MVSTFILLVLFGTKQAECHNNQPFVIAVFNYILFTKCTIARVKYTHILPFVASECEKYLHPHDLRIINK